MNRRQRKRSRGENLPVCPKCVESMYPRVNGEGRPIYRCKFCGFEIRASTLDGFVVRTLEDKQEADKKLKLGE